MFKIGNLSRIFFVVVLGFIFFAPLRTLAARKIIRPANKNASISVIQRHAIDYAALSQFVSAFKNKLSQPVIGSGGDDIFAPRGEQKTQLVRLVYLVPYDKVKRDDYALGIEKAIKHLQIWYSNELGGTKSFKLHNPVVEIVLTPHHAAWYSENQSGDYNMLFWQNVLSDAFAHTDGKFNDPKNRWIYYIDADPACGQIQGAGTSGVTVLPANDLRGLARKERVRICPNDPYDNTPICRWIGGLGHELGHAFNLPHPLSCEGTSFSVLLCPSQALMWLGYQMYPSAYLTSENKAKLKNSIFFKDTFASPRALPACGA